MTATAATKPRKSGRPSLAAISLYRNLYMEVCEEQGFDPLPSAVMPRLTDASGWSLNIVRAFEPGGILCV